MLSIRIGLKDDDGYFSNGPLLIFLIGRISAGDLRPQALSFIAPSISSTHTMPFALLEQACPRFCLEVEVPCRMPRLPDVRCDDDLSVSDPERIQGDFARLT
jgi:hypothetical protein